MAHLILAETTASVSELKRNPMGTVAAGEGFSRRPSSTATKPAFYCIPAKAPTRRSSIGWKTSSSTRSPNARAADGKEPVKVSLDDL